MSDIVRILRVILFFALLIFAGQVWHQAFGATVTLNGKTCALPAGAYSTSPLLLPVCGGYFTCKPEGTAYLATATLVVQTECTEHLFINGFDNQ